MFSIIKDILSLKFIANRPLSWLIRIGLLWLVVDHLASIKFVGTQMQEQAESINGGAAAQSAVLISEVNVPELIADEQLRQCISRSSGFIVNREKTTDALTYLDCAGLGITNLSGVELFPQIHSVSLQQAEVLSLEPLHSLAQLNSVDLTDVTTVTIEQVYALAPLKKIRWPVLAEIPCTRLRELAGADKDKLMLLKQADNRSCWGANSNATRNELVSFRMKDSRGEYISNEDWFYFQKLEKEYNANKSYDDAKGSF
ncbi:hypothetical protein [Reinekea marinisedimentorum]|uniref:hypothetical protein n=1 Tax=Reinekea marinisedimentorum TaxID=230495 RepID=UPI001046534B|nr:hypothetical protein [Reinekea marinisedimentorum]